MAGEDRFSHLIVISLGDVCIHLYLLQQEARSGYASAYPAVFGTPVAQWVKVLTSSVVFHVKMCKQEHSEGSEESKGGLDKYSVPGD